MLLICVFMCYYTSLSIKTVSIVVLLGVILMNVVAFIRGNIEALNNPEEILTFLTNMGGTTELPVISQEGDVIYATSRLVGFVEKQILSISDRFNSFVSFISLIFMPSSCVSEFADLSTYKLRSYPHGGGGMIFGYFYCFLSYFGVAFIGYYLAKVLSALKCVSDNRNSLKSSFVVFYAYFAVFTLPRWFAYNPITLFKLSLIGAVYISLLIWFHQRIIK